MPSESELALQLAPVLNTIVKDIHVWIAVDQAKSSAAASGISYTFSFELHGVSPSARANSIRFASMIARTPQRRLREALQATNVQTLAAHNSGNDDKNKADRNDFILYIVAGAVGFFLILAAVVIVIKQRNNSRAARNEADMRHALRDADSAGRLHSFTSDGRAMSARGQVNDDEESGDAVASTSYFAMSKDKE